MQERGEVMRSEVGETDFAKLERAHRVKQRCDEWGHLIWFKSSRVGALYLRLYP
jgi:hypothetical protein